jgi:hypothetical protein
MAFSRSKYNDVRQSTFNEVGRDHITNHIQLNFSLFGSRQTPTHVSLNISDDLLRPTSYPEISTPRRPVVTVDRSPDVGLGLESAIGLIIQITDLLIDPRNHSNTHWDLVLELKSLQQTLTLTALAIQEYENRPLGRSVANTITPELARCYNVLQELLSRVKDTWHGLKFTIVGDFWCPIWWSRWDGNEFYPLRIKLSNSRRSIEGFLMALHSYVSHTFQASSSAEIPPITNIQCRMGGFGKQIARRPRTPQKLS